MKSGWVLWALCLSMECNLGSAIAQSMAPAPPAAARPARPTPPTRDPDTSGYVTAKELPDAIVAPKDADGDKLVHSAIAGQNGRVLFPLLPDGKYQVVIPREGTLDVAVLPQKSNINGPLISWFLFPKSKYKWVAGKKVAGNPCPILALKAD
jgi:hypothetical protein